MCTNIDIDDQLIREVMEALGVKTKKEAATLYRTCRQQGLTIRKPNDCLIAHYCLSYDLSLLTVDTDFDYIARVFPLQIVEV